MFHNLVFVEGREPRTLDRRDMSEDFLFAAGRLDEPVTLVGFNHLTVRFCIACPSFRT